MNDKAAPPIVDHDTWANKVKELRIREKKAQKELDAIAAQRRRLPMTEVPNYTLQDSDEPVKLSDIFDGRSQLIVYSHMWEQGAEWQCQGCTAYTAQFTPFTEALKSYDARFVFVAEAPIQEIHSYGRKVGSQVPFYSTLGSDYMKECADFTGPFALNVFFRIGEKVYRTYMTSMRGMEQVQYIFGLLDRLPYGRQEEWEDSPEGWPQGKTYSKWRSSEEVAKMCNGQA